FDLSLSKVPIAYLADGGVIDKHNYDKNIHFNKLYEDEVFDELCIIVKQRDEDIKKMRLLFGEYRNPVVIESTKAANNRWDYIKGNESMPFDCFLSSSVLGRYEETIQENIQIIENFIQWVQGMNPKVKIIFTLMPVYVTMEKVLAVFKKEWKEDFENIVRRLQKKYGVYFINYKNRAEISENNHFYHDITHLNTIGGRCMTSILNEDIKKIACSSNNKNWLI
ncbi:MAG TPA: hypothetical protein DDY31_10065, partial [Lachnospiraceae bacterium]|nr:hypothetical protein [Lachnospiraceae bacterium]